MKRVLGPAVFVDRDGTIIREREYLSDPAGVELLPGAVAGLRAFQAAGRALVIVTNQSGIGRGLYGEEEYQAVQREVVRQLEANGIRLLASYHCPHHPDYTGPCDCRKPSTGLFRLAAADHGLELDGAVFVGDRVRDVLPARELGGQGILVRTGYGAHEAAGMDGDFPVVADLEAAAAVVLRSPTRVDTPDQPS